MHKYQASNNTDHTSPSTPPHRRVVGLLLWEKSLWCYQLGPVGQRMKTPLDCRCVLFACVCAHFYMQLLNTRVRKHAAQSIAL